MKIILSYRLDRGKRDRILPSYAHSMYIALKAINGCEVLQIGEGHEVPNVDSISESEIKKYDLFIDVDCGRNKDGKQSFQYVDKPCPIPGALRSVDAHGNPSLHRRIAKNYKHVFFAVYDKRDIFASHSNATWLPNASDDIHFDYIHHFDKWNNPTIDFGFFGSKGGLERADDLISICSSIKGCTYDVREIGRQFKSRWPRTAEAMANCRYLFNRGQKHDGPNQRVIESMLLNRPLITDRDDRDGMRLLFDEDTHYLGYSSKEELEEKIKYCLNNPDKLQTMANSAYNEVKTAHLIKHRVKDILVVCGIY